MSPNHSTDLEGLLGVVLPHLCDELADPEARARLAAAGRVLPGGCAGVFEVRLTPPAHRVDLALCLRRPAAARRVAEAVSEPAVRHFLIRWADGTWPQLPSLWVEWDLDPAPDPLALDTLPPPILIAKLGGPAEPAWVTGELLPALLGRPLSRQRTALAERCLAGLSQGRQPGRLLYAFALPARPGRPLRLEICGLELAAAMAWLEPWAPGHAWRLTGLAPLFAGVAEADRERLHLSLDLLDEGLGPRFGVEGSFARLPHREPRWRELFDRLVAAGLCTRGRRDAVLAWPGWDSFRTAPEDWPVAEAGLAGFCARGLSHVKVVSEPGRPPEAKAYLAFNSVRTRRGEPATIPRRGTGARSPAG